MKEKTNEYYDGYVDGAMETSNKLFSALGLFLFFVAGLAPWAVLSVYFSFGIIFGGYCFFAMYQREYGYPLKKSLLLALQDLFLWPWSLRDDYILGPHPVREGRKRRWQERKSEE